MISSIARDKEKVKWHYWLRVADKYNKITDQTSDFVYCIILSYTAHLAVRYNYKTIKEVLEHTRETVTTQMRENSRLLRKGQLPDDARLKALAARCFLVEECYHRIPLTIFIQVIRDRDMKEHVEPLSIADVIYLEADVPLLADMNLRHLWAK